VAPERIEVGVLPRPTGTIAVGRGAVGMRGPPCEAPEAVAVDHEARVEFVEQAGQIVVVGLHVEAAGLAEQLRITACGQKTGERTGKVRVYRSCLDITVARGDPEPHWDHAGIQDLGGVRRERGRDGGTVDGKFGSHVAPGHHERERARREPRGGESQRALRPPPVIETRTRPRRDAP
jgi:hypothetical protein